MTTIQIAVVDDHPIVRDGLIAVLSTQSRFAIAGEASNGQEAISLLQKTHCDVLLLDLEMPVLDGVQTLWQIQQEGIIISTIVFTAFDTDERIVEAVQAGAKGYLLKGAPRDELFNAIQVVYAGGSLLQPIIASKLMDRLNQPEPLQSQSPLIEPLTPRELEVLHLMARGLQNKEIAAQLIVTERTIKFHASSIMGKLGAGNRTEAVALAVEYGILER
ncbi:MAG: response regulator transcription factor [Chloroflexota bacterium]